MSLTSLESVLDEPIIINSTGSTRSGKSTFISALHGVLGYDKAGMKIDKDILPRGGGEEGKRKRVNKAYEKQKKGLFSTNSTYRPDSMYVYGVNGSDTYAFNFLAPGGHANAVRVDSKIDGLLYFIDLKLVDFVKDIDKMGSYKLGKYNQTLFVEEGNVVKSIETEIENTIDTNYFHPPQRVIDLIRKDAGAPEDCNTIDKLAKFLAENTYKNMPPFGFPAKENQPWVDRDCFVLYKNELLGEVVQGMIDSHKYTLSKLNCNVPVIGVGTHMDVAHDKLPKNQDALLRFVQNNLNKTISKFVEYQRAHDIKADDFHLDLIGNTQMPWHFVGLLKRIKRYKGSDPKKIEVFKNSFKEVLNRKNPAVLKIAYDIMTEALRHKGIEPDGFKIMTFSKKQSDLTTRCI